MLVVFYMLLLLTNLSSAWSINKKYEEGVYEFTFDGPGGLDDITPNVTYYKIDPSLNFTISKSGGKPPRIFTKRHCKKKSVLDYEDTQYAKRGLMAWCETHSPQPKSIVISVFRNTTFFFASWEYGGQHRFKPPAYCSAKDVEGASEHLDKKCRLVGPGVSYTAFLERYYGRALQGDDIFP